MKKYVVEANKDREGKRADRIDENDFEPPSWFIVLIYSSRCASLLKSYSTRIRVQASIFTEVWIVISTTVPAVVDIYLKAYVRVHTTVRFRTPFWVIYETQRMQGTRWVSVQVYGTVHRDSDSTTDSDSNTDSDRLTATVPPTDAGAGPLYSTPTPTLTLTLAAATVTVTVLILSVSLSSENPNKGQQLIKKCFKAIKAYSTHPTPLRLRSTRTTLRLL